MERMENLNTADNLGQKNHIFTIDYQRNFNRKLF